MVVFYLRLFSLLEASLCFFCLVRIIFKSQREPNQRSALVLTLFLPVLGLPRLLAYNSNIADAIVCSMHMGLAPGVAVLVLSVSELFC